MLRPIQMLSSSRPRGPRAYVITSGFAITRRITAKLVRISAARQIGSKQSISGFERGVNQGGERHEVSRHLEYRTGQMDTGCEDVFGLIAGGARRRRAGREDR